MEEISLLQFDFIGDILSSDGKKEGQYFFPQLSEERYIPKGKVLPVNYMMSCDNIKNHWFHCFVDDSQFQRLWNNYWKYIPILKKTAGIISTDFSLYRDYSKDILIRNCFKNRAITYAMQNDGIKVIPTAGFGGEETWDWCFDGLPHNSTVAVTTNGTLHDPEARRLFVGGIDAMVKKINPYAIVVCGKYPKWLNTKYPKIKIIPISSYSQMWQERRCK